jgi:hypothetical protein
MRNLLTPKWILLLNTGPLLLLAALCYGEFTVIRTLLPAESVAMWRQLALGLAGLGTATLGYAAATWWRGRPLSTWYAGAALLAYAAFLTWYTFNSALVLPRAVPRWMVPTDILVYVWTFVMPTLAHALLVLVVRSVPDDHPRSALPSLALAVGVPVAAWMLLGVCGFLYNLVGWAGIRWLDSLFLGFSVLVGPIAFLFFLVRGIYLLTLNRQNDEWSLAWKFLITLVLPLLGLCVNTGLFMNGFGSNSTGIFGNFNTPWFYGLAVLNGVLLCVPSPAAPGGRLALLAARGALLGYTGYFFLVFLPFLPLSLVAVIAIGTGFLMLAPLVLLVVHLRVLADDVAALQTQVARWVPRAVLLGSLAVLPLLLTADYYHDRRVLHAALAYVYTPSYTQAYDLDAASLGRTLAVVRQHKENNFDFFMGSQQPYLSAYYNWLVLDNLMLSENKITALESVFAPSPAASPAITASFVNNVPAAPNAPVLRQLAARSAYDARQQAWVSWVDLAVSNASPAQQVGEYSTTFELPAGCWVSDYYLDIEGRREPGILAEKKAAEWVYTQIVQENTRRDPGLLAYASPDQLRLQVYPVLGDTPRRTGIQLLHKDPVALTIDGQTVTLGQPGTVPPTTAPVATPGGAVVYLSAAAKQHLPLVQRQPYYHFLLDASAAKAGRKAAYKEWVTAFLQQHKSAAPSRFTLVNTYATPVPAGADWQRQLDDFANAGGCYLTGAVQRTLAEAQLHPAARYPVLVVVTDSLASAVLASDFATFAPAYPEGATFLKLGPGGQAVAHSLRTASAQPLAAEVTASAVRAWPTAAHPQAYLPDDARPSVVLAQPAAGLAPPPASLTRWQAGLLLRGHSQWQALHPAEADAQHLAFTQASFQHRILTPLTAFLALENEAQKAALHRKQSETLAANANLDTQEEGPHPAATEATQVPLDDYAPLLLLLGVGLGAWRLRRRPRLAALR